MSVDEVFRLREEILECKQQRPGSMGHMGSSDRVGLVVALNKSDLPACQWRLNLEELQTRLDLQTHQHQAELGWSATSIVRCSAKSGLGVDEVRMKRMKMGRW